MLLWSSFECYHNACCYHHPENIITMHVFVIILWILYHNACCCDHHLNTITMHVVIIILRILSQCMFLSSFCEYCITMHIYWWHYPMNTIKYMLVALTYEYNSKNVYVVLCFFVCLVMCCRPDMTFAVHGALKNQFSSYLWLCVSSVCTKKEKEKKRGNSLSLNFFLLKLSFLYVYL